MRRADQNGFTLLELLVVVAVIGILVAIAIPNFLNALDRGRQKRTMSDVRSLGVAVESYAVDVSYYPRNQSSATIPTTVQPHIQPTFIRDAPLKDGWGYELEYGSNPNGSQYTIGSYGKDGLADAGTTGETTDFDCDILFSNGEFVQWPEGIQT